MMFDPCLATARTLASGVSTKAMSASEVVTAAIARAETVQPQINCLAISLFEEATEAALRADRQVARGAALGPLHGVPITIKDGIATAGHRLTFGSASRADVVAVDDDPVWSRLKAAGAILIGKTTAPEFFHKVVTDSILFGITRNPWSLDHTPGGSSGGAAAGLAAGIAPLALGSDGGGSLRCPASCTGTLALKPTMGRVPHSYFPDTFGNFSCMGPMASDVRDLALMLEIMAGPSNRDAISLSQPPLGSFGVRETAGPKPLRIGWIADPGSYGADPTIVAAALGALQSLDPAGSRVEALDGSFLDSAFETYIVIGSCSHASRARTQTAADQALWSDSFRALVARGLSYAAGDLQQAQEDRTRLFRAVQTVFEKVDVIATPTLNAPPKRVGDEGSVGSAAYAAWAAALYPFNLTGHPAISVPCGSTSAGLPIGLQLVAPWHAEARLLHLAAQLEQTNPWAGRRPAS